MTFASPGEIYGALGRVVRRGGRTYPWRSRLSPVATCAGYCVVATRSPDLCAPSRGEEAHLQGVSLAPASPRRPIAVLDAIEDGALRIARSSYFAMLATCDSLRIELDGIDHLGSHGLMRSSVLGALFAGDRLPLEAASPR
jgi:hypothetical protein